MKQETLEEVAERYAEYNEFLSDRPFEFKRDKVAFICGAKWQKETYNQFTLAMADLKSSREGYLNAKKEYELKQQERMYSEGDLESAWASSEQNMRFAFSSSKYKNIKFKQWFEQFKKK